MGKIASFCKKYGIDLKRPAGWAMLFRRAGGFVRRHKWHAFGEAVRRYKNSVYEERELTYPRVHAASLPSEAERDRLSRLIAPLARRVKMYAVVMPSEGGEGLGLLFADLAAQVFPAAGIVLCGRYAAAGFAAEKYLREGVRAAASPSEAYALCADGYAVTLREGDRADVSAFYRLAAALAGKEAAAAYCDHDEIEEGALCRPFFKPAFSPDLFLSFDYVRGAYAVQGGLAARLADDTLSYSALLYDLLLKASEQGEILCAQGALLHFPPAKEEEELNAVRRAALARRGRNADLCINRFGVLSVEERPAGEPRVSVIIPTCFTKGLVQKCIASVHARSTYKNYEIVVIDNSRRPPEYGRAQLEGCGCRILYLPEPFNWSRLNNLAARAAEGEFLLFLNDDTEVLTPDWMERMLAEAGREEVGEVGALLLYPNGMVQHAGGFLVAEGGGARHFFQYDRQESGAYHGFLHRRRECTFLTGACIMVQRKKFEEAGGFDENFAVVSNDVEFGIRLREKGYRNLYLPDVCLIHKEKVSRRETGEKPGAKYAWQVLGARFALGDEYVNAALVSGAGTPRPDKMPPRTFVSCAPVSKESAAAFSVTKTERAEASAFFASLAAKPKVALAAGGEVLPAEEYAKLADIVFDGTGAPLLLLAEESGLKEAEKIASLAAEGRALVAPAAGEGQLAAFIGGCKYLVAPEEKYARMAAAEGTVCVPVVGARLFPSEGKCVSAARTVLCRPCDCRKKRDCPHGNACRVRLTAADIWRALREAALLFGESYPQM